eukprot:TRINITY_DN21688_c0_g1_i1.p1 TRINITY_DN21688_c0_g1~~TRINITY_DN21688_c0_g1_i1.p1  ORF type:complete len:438 (-),score=112.32 TRINITY_DN21688_c0_g1_i1:22-1314(-)
MMGDWDTNDLQFQFDLPSEVVEIIMFKLEIEELYYFSEVNALIYKLSHNEALWKNAFSKSLPKIHIAMSQLPKPDYWQYSSLSSRLFAYLALKERARLVHSHKLPIMDPSMEPRIVVTLMERCLQRKDLPLLLTGCFILRRLTYTPLDCSAEYQQEMVNNRNYLGDFRAAEILLKTLRIAEATQPELVAASICAINNLACDTNCEKFVKELGIQSILQAIKNFSSNVAVLDYGASALANIMRDIQDQKIIQLIISNVHIILNLFKMPDIPPKNMISVLDLCTVLAKHNEDFSMKYGPIVIPLVKEVLVKSTNDTPNNVVFVCCLALHEFCNQSAEANRNIALSISLVPLLLDLAERFNETNVLYVIFMAVCFLLWENSEKYKAEFDRFVEVAIQKMKQNEKDTKLQLGLAVILGNYAAATKFSLMLMEGN